MARVLDSKIALTLCGPALRQAALAEFFSSGGYDSHLRRVRRTFRENIDRMIRTIDRAFPKGLETLGELSRGRLTRPRPSSRTIETPVPVLRARAGRR